MGRSWREGWRGGRRKEGVSVVWDEGRGRGRGRGAKGRKAWQGYIPELLGDGSVSFLLFLQYIFTFCLPLLRHTCTTWARVSGQSWGAS